MKRVSRQDVDKALEAQRATGTCRQADDFWADFKPRASLRAQETPVPRRPAVTARWALVGACAALLVLAAAGVAPFVSGRGRPVGAIRSVEVAGAHQAVLIMEDGSTGSTVLWILGMNGDEPNGETQ